MSDRPAHGIDSLPPIQSVDVNGDEAERMQSWHEETRFHRGIRLRRSRIIARFLKDPAVIRKITDLHPRAFGDRVIPLADPPIERADVQQALARRTSTVRPRLTGTVPEAQISALLHLAVRPNRWVKSSVADVRFGLRPYPSAGALYPCDIYVVMGDGETAGLPLRYDAGAHALIDYGVPRGDFRCVEMDVLTAPPPCAVVIAGVFSRATAKYGPRGYRFALLEAGHIGQNLVLAATSLGLPSLVSGSYFDAELERWLGLDGRDEAVLSVVLIGEPLQSSED